MGTGLGIRHSTDIPAEKFGINIIMKCIYGDNFSEF